MIFKDKNDNTDRKVICWQNIFKNEDKIYLVDPAKEAHLGHRLSHASLSSGNETAYSSLTDS